MKSNNEEYRQYLDPEFISKFTGLKVVTDMILKGFMLGIHSSPLHGFSAEFSSHKQYTPGDPVKFIDWKIFGKTDKYYIKRFEDETNLYANIFVDFSASMNYKNENSKMTKLSYAKQLAAALIQLLILQNDAVGYGVYAENLKKYIPPKSSRGHLKTLLLNVATDKVYKENFTYKSFDDIKLQLNKSGITIIISDFLEDSERLIEKITFLKQRKQDVFCFMIADDYEYNFGYDKSLLMIDAETDEKINVEANLIKKKYKKVYDDLIENYRVKLREKGIDFLFITTKTFFDIPLREMLLLRSKKIV